MHFNKTVVILVACVHLFTHFVNLKSDKPFTAYSLEERAEMVGLDIESFTIFSAVVESESNRCQDDIEGRVYIALTIWNRVYSERWPDSVIGVLTQSGQFSTVHGSSGNYYAAASRTDLSDQAVVAAYNWIHSGEEYPEVIFFNCRGYFSGVEPYCESGGNYFSLGA